MRSHLAVALVAGIVMLLGGCTFRTEHKIEAHVVVDIRYIKEDISKIEDMVSGEAGEEQESGNSSQVFEIMHLYACLAHGLVPAQLPVVVAAENAGTVSRLEQAIERRKKRFKEIMVWKDRGVLGENNRGYVEIVEYKGLSKKELKNLEKLVADENKDRRIIYEEVAKRRGLPKEAVKEIEKVAAAEQRKRAKVGHWIQLENGKWVRKAPERK